MPRGSWTTREDLRESVLRLWNSGKLFETALYPHRLSLKRPTTGDLLHRFQEVREWVATFLNFPLRVECKTRSHQALGRNEIPHFVWIDSLDQAAGFIGKTSALRTWRRLRQLTERRLPELEPWVDRKPLQALELAPVWERLLEVVLWMRSHPRSGLYLRQIDLPGVHSKFIEQHQRVLGELCSLALPPGCYDPVETDFVKRFGLRGKPSLVRFRLLDGWNELPDGISDLTLPLEEFRTLAPAHRRVFIVENEVTFLAFPPVEQSLVIFGSGYRSGSLKTVDWLAQRELVYWGDIDTHGFRILDRLRKSFPHLRSVLMDRETLLDYRDSWVTEAQPYKGELERLTAEEAEVFQALQRGEFGEGVRLEQEVIPLRLLWGAMGLGRPQPSARSHTAR